MGRGLGSLQQGILAMANFNRVADGLDYVSVPTVVIVHDAPAEPLKFWLDSLRFIADRLLSRKPWLIPGYNGIHHLWDIHDVIAESRLFGGMIGTWDYYALCCKSLFKEVNDALTRAGFDPLSPDALIRCPDCDRFPGRDVLIWAYKPFATRPEAVACRDRLRNAELGEAQVEIINMFGELSDLPHLLFVEVLADLYGFRRHLTNAGAEKSRRLPPGSLFDRQAIGERRYNAASAATSKAVAGLAGKGLVSRTSHKSEGEVWTNRGVVLTQSGVQEAERVTAKNCDILKGLSLYNNGHP
jgi:hypothetical protein